jgi:putative Mn2+ efflux pump MntP
MSILPPLLFGISASLDALLVGMALGLQKVPLPARHNLLISTVTLIGTVISIALGNLLLPLFPIGIGTRIGSSVLILFGLYYVGKWLLSRWHCNFSRIIICARRRKILPGTGNYPCRRYWRWAVPFP